MISVHFIGRVGKDAQVKSGQHGDFLTMDVADELYSRGEKKTRWTRIKAGDPAIVRMARYYTKGKPLEIRGELMEDDEWETNGEKRHQHVVKANRIDFVPGGRRQDGGQQAADGVPPAEVVNEPQPFPAPEGSADDLPF